MSEAIRKTTGIVELTEGRTVHIMNDPALRPHHGMCIQFYKGKGYSSDFTDHMGKVIKGFADAPGQLVQLMSETDIICEACPNNEAGICTSQDKVERYDEEVLKACGILEGERVPYEDFKALVKERIIDTNHRSAICGDCSWDPVCREK